MNAKTTGDGKAGSDRTQLDDGSAAQGSACDHAAAAARISCPEREQIDLLKPSVLQDYLRRRRWFASKDQELGAVHLAIHVCVDAAGFAFAEFDIELPQGKERYCLPLAVLSDVDGLPESNSELLVTRLDEHNHSGGLIDAFAVPEFARGVVALLTGRAVLKTSDAGEIVCNATDHIDALNLPEGGAARVHWLSAEQSNSSLVIDNRVVLKLVRRVVGGVHPEAEMTRYLTARGYSHAAPLFGEVLRVDAEGLPHTLCILQGFLPNEGDAWSCALGYLRQALEAGLRDDVASGDSPTGNDQQDCIDGYCRLAASIGRRVGELHAVLASPTEDEAFCPHMTTSGDVRRWTNGVVELMSAAFDTLAERIDLLNGEARAAARSLLARRAAVLDHARTLVSGDAQALCLRIHGDLHLGQVLIAEGDAYVIDFEGEPARPVQERRRKASPLRDVAGMLRSFRYASATVAAETGDAGARGVAYTAALVQQFSVRAEVAFLTAYRDALAAADLSITHNEQTFATLLELFLLEKAAYEIRYEAANRPGWMAVPLRGLSDLVDQSLGTS